MPDRSSHLSSHLSAICSLSIPSHPGSPHFFLNVQSPPQVEEAAEAPEAKKATASARKGHAAKASQPPEPCPSGQTGGTISLARRNGEGDGSSVSDAVLRRLWPRVLALATDTGCGAGGANPQEEVAGVSLQALQVQLTGAAAVRRCVCMCGC